VGLNPARQAIEFSILNFNGELQTLSWDKPEEISAPMHVWPFREHFKLKKNQKFSPAWL
jgi:hypothetical protein